MQGHSPGPSQNSTIVKGNFIFRPQRRAGWHVGEYSCRSEEFVHRFHAVNKLVNVLVEYRGHHLPKEKKQVRRTQLRQRAPPWGDEMRSSLPSSLQQVPLVGTDPSQDQRLTQGSSAPNKIYTTDWGSLSAIASKGSQWRRQRIDLHHRPPVSQRAHQSRIDTPFYT